MKKDRKIAKSELKNKRRLLLDLENQINNIQKELNKEKYYRKKGIKAFTSFIAPYLLVAGVGFGAASLAGMSPFYTGNRKLELHTTKEMDSLGNISYEEEYLGHVNDEHMSNYNLVLCYGEWKKCDNNYFERSVKTYQVDPLAYENVEDFLKRDLEDIEKILGEPTSNKIETRNNVAEEELKQKEIIKVITYSTSSDKYVVVQESSFDNLFDTAFFLFAIGLIELCLRKVSTELDLPIANRNRAVRELKECRRNLNPDANYIKQLKKSLKTEMDNYNRLRK